MTNRHRKQVSGFRLSNIVKTIYVDTIARVLMVEIKCRRNAILPRFYESTRWFMNRRIYDWTGTNRNPSFHPRIRS